MRSRNPLHSLCVKQLMRAEHLSLSLIKLLAVTVLAGVISAAPAYAADPQDIHSFVACLKSINKPNPTVADAVACVPSGCYSTVTLSQESAQPACTLNDGTRLPRVIFSCPGPGGSQTLRFRPSFTLCTQPRNLINHIEVGEDVRRGPDANVQKMADIDSPPDLPSFQVLTEFGAGATAVVDTKVPANNKGCFDCHDRMGTVSTGGNTVNLFSGVLPELAEGTIYSNDPSVVHPASPTPLSAICTGIANSSKLRNTSRGALAIDLCNELVLKTN